MFNAKIGKDLHFNLVMKKTCFKGLLLGKTCAIQTNMNLQCQDIQEVQ